jgi:2-polyprenyl-3-methyl-5-hydroxy-6-metoxy-1,4-benzoquinol methylase
MVALNPPLERLLAAMESHARFARDSVHRAAAQFGPAWVEGFGELLQRLYAGEHAVSDAVQGYGAFAMDAMRRQKRFERDRRYVARSYAEAAAEVYHNDEHMRRQYLPGLLLSHYLWAHHVQQVQYFEGFFLPWLKQHGVTRFAEVGVGTGLYSRLLLQHLPEVHGTGLDISPMSLQFTQAHVAAYGSAERYTALNHDILQSPLPEPFTERYAAVVCVEVLEHLEDPTAMLRGLRGLCTTDGRLFVTAALNAADADHIHLYRKPEDVVAQVEAAGLHVEHCFHANAYAPPAPGVPVPSALAMVLSPVR